MRPYLQPERPSYISPTEADGLAPLLFQKFYSNKAISIYLIGLCVCNLLFFHKILSPLFWVSGIVAVYGFFQYSQELSRKWAAYSEKRFEKKLFRTALLLRIIWVVVSYVMYTVLTGQPFEWHVADAMFYHHSGEWIVDLFKQGHYHQFLDSLKGGYSDAGYATYLGILYSISGKSILVVRLLKAVYGALTAVLLYRLAKRTFGEQVGRLSGIFALLMPNLIFYCGSHLKEAEMVFLTVLFLERADALLREKRIGFSSLLLPLFAAGSLFLFRTVLGVTVIFSLLTTLILSRDKLMKMGRRTLIAIWVVLAGSYFVGGKIMSEVEEVWNKRADNQKTSMEWRAKRENGNKFAKYAGGAVFAPMIFVIPFPTVVGTPNQEVMQFVNGGNFVKNVLGFFMLLALYTIIKQKKWRDYLLIGSFTIGYLGVLAMSAFAQSERFHQPVLPFELIIAAYGVSIITKKQKKWFGNWMLFLLIVMVVWSWFKLAGRGMA